MASLNHPASSWLLSDTVQSRACRTSHIDGCPSAAGVNNPWTPSVHPIGTSDLARVIDSGCLRYVPAWIIQRRERSFTKQEAMFIARLIEPYADNLSRRVDAGRQLLYRARVIFFGEFTAVVDISMIRRINEKTDHQP